MKAMFLGSNEINIRIGVGVSWVCVSWFFWCFVFICLGFIWHGPDNATENKTRHSAFVKMIRQNLKLLAG